MEKIYSFMVLGAIILFSSCQRQLNYPDLSQPSFGADPFSNTLSGGFSATIDGKRTNFAITSATLMRYTITNEKRIDIAGISTDNKKKLTITIGEKTSLGNAVTAKKYILNLYPSDEPSTPNIDESMQVQGYTNYGTMVGGNWYFDTYKESGSFTVISCDAATTRLSGLFETTLTDQTNSNHVIKITDGVAKNIKYKVIN